MYVLSVNGIYPVLGWVGTLAYLLAYFLLSINKLNARQVSYHTLNVVGAVGLTVNSLYYTDLPNVVVNIVWGIIAVSAVIVLYRKKKQREKEN
jgi:ABC-type transport system involved in multi-copper enzyme maturation permease subunit